MDEQQLEYLKHRLKLREILLDKFVLAVLLGVLAFAANWRMKSYESTLQAQLEQLKGVYNFQRILAEKDIAAHEEVWKAVAAFRYKANSYLGKEGTDTNVTDVQNAALELVHVADTNEIYLTPQTKAAVNELTGKRLNEFAEKWASDGKGGLSEATLKFLDDSMNKVRDQIESDVSARRQGQLTRPSA